MWSEGVLRANLPIQLGQLDKVFLGGVTLLARVDLQSIWKCAALSSAGSLAEGFTILHRPLLQLPLLRPSESARLAACLDSAQSASAASQPELATRLLAFQQSDARHPILEQLMQLKLSRDSKKRFSELPSPKL